MQDAAYEDRSGDAVERLLRDGAESLEAIATGLNEIEMSTRAGGIVDCRPACRRTEATYCRHRVSGLRRDTPSDRCQRCYVGDSEQP